MSMAKEDDAWIEDDEDGLIIEELSPSEPADDDDDLVIEEVTEAGKTEDEDDDLIIEEVTLADEDDEDDDLIIEEVTAADDDDDDLIIEEVIPADDDDDDLIIEEVREDGEAAEDDETDGLNIEEVTTTDFPVDNLVKEEGILPSGEEANDGSGQISSLATAQEGETDDSDTESDSDDSMIVIEEVEAPEVTGREGLRSGFFMAKKKSAPVSAAELRRLAETKRCLGNEEFAKKRYREAKAYYTQAIEVDPYDYKSYSNRSACHVELCSFEAGKEDATECVRLAPEFGKGYFRLARSSKFCGDFETAESAATKGLEILGQTNRELRDELGEIKKLKRSERQRKRIQGELRELCAEMTPEERRWKAWWGGQGHPTMVDNSNLDRFIPDARIDCSYDPTVSQELHGPDNLPRLEEEDDEDEDDLLLEEVLRRLGGEDLLSLMPAFEDDGMGPRSFLTCARLVPPLLERWLDQHCSPSLSLKEVSALADAQARDCLEESWDKGSESLAPFPSSKGLAFTYSLFSWRQRVNDLELRVLLPLGCTARDLVVTMRPRRITVVVKRSGLRFWPYVKNAWSKIADVGPQLPNTTSSEEEEEEEELDPIHLAKEQSRSAAQAFREASAATSKSDAEQADEVSVLDEEDEPIVEELDEDDEPIVEELDEDDEPIVEELDEDDEPIVEELDEDDEPTVETEEDEGSGGDVSWMEVRWVEEGVVLKTISVSQPRSVAELNEVIETEFQLPKELQKLSKINGEEVDEDMAPIVEVRERGPAPPDEIVLLDLETSRKIVVDESIWHISKPASTKGHAMQGPILVFQIQKFQSLRRGTASHAGQLYWKRMFLGTPFEDENVQDRPPSEFYKWK